MKLTIISTAYTVLWVFLHGAFTGQPLPFIIVAMGYIAIYGLVERYDIAFEEFKEIDD